MRVAAASCERPRKDTFGSLLLKVWKGIVGGNHQSGCDLRSTTQTMIFFDFFFYRLPTILTGPRNIKSIGMA